jgi:hypothetical protein
MFIFKITSPMNSQDGSFFKYDKTFASDLYLKYKLSPSARVCISDTDRLLMFYLVLNNTLICFSNEGMLMVLYL